MLHQQKFPDTEFVRLIQNPGPLLPHTRIQVNMVAGR
jgi:hypothetical protein